MKLNSTTTNGFNLQIINSLMQSWGVCLICPDCNIILSTTINIFHIKQMVNSICSHFMNPMVSFLNEIDINGPTMGHLQLIHEKMTRMHIHYKVG